MLFEKRWLVAVMLIALLPTAMAFGAVQLKFNYDYLPEDTEFVGGIGGTNPTNYNAMNWDRDRGDEVDGVPTFPDLVGVDGQGVLDSIDFVTGLTTGVSLTVTSPNGFNEVGPNTDGTLGPGAPASTFFDAEATDINLFGHTSNFNVGEARDFVEYTIEGLSPSGLYDFTFFGARFGPTDNRETQYDVIGANNGFGLLNVTDNNNNVAQVLQIQPNGAGELKLTIQKGPNNDNTAGFYYLGAFEILENGAVAGPAGDFDGDLDVDGADFLLWQRDTSIGSLGDWESNFGAGSLSTLASVPEPTSIMLLLLGFLTSGRVARSIN